MSVFRLALSALLLLLLTMPLNAQQVAGPERIRDLILEMMEQTGQMAALRRDHARYGEIFREIAGAAELEDADGWARRVDQLFPQQQIERAVGEFAKDQQTAYMIEHLLGMSRDADMRQALRWINGADPTPGHAEPASDQRQQLIDQLMSFGRFHERIGVLQNRQQQFAMALFAALDPSASPVSLSPAQAPSQVPVPVNFPAVYEQWVKPAVAPVSEQTLSELGMILADPPGSTYLGMVTQLHGLIDGAAMDALLAELKASRMDQVRQQQGSTQLTQVAEARRLFFNDTGPNARQQARELLARLNADHPNNAEILTLLARIEMNDYSGPRAGSFALRLPNFDAPLDEVERLIELALKADPDFAEALVLKAWTRFLDSKDDEVAALLARAEQIDPEATWLRANQADLATVQGRNDEAIAGYKAVLAQPEKERHLHLVVLRRSWVAHAQAGRLPDWEALARNYMEQRPDDPYLPLFYAEHLLKTDQDPDAAIAMARRSHDRANPRFRNLMIGAAEWIKAQQLREQSGSWSADSIALIGQGMASSGAGSAELVGYVCGLRRTVKPLLLLVERQELGEEGKRALFACALQTRDPRWMSFFAKNGIDLDAALAPTPWSPLEYTWMYEDPASFQALLAAGADPGRPNSNGMSSIEEMIRNTPAPDSPFVKALDARKQ